MSQRPVKTIFSICSLGSLWYLMKVILHKIQNEAIKVKNNEVGTKTLKDFGTCGQTTKCVESWYEIKQGNNTKLQINL